jgi:uncharacterized membrane protein
VVRLLYLRHGRRPLLIGGAVFMGIWTFLFFALLSTESTVLISVYIAVLCALSVLCYFLADETYRKDIYEEEPEERRLVAQQQG